MRILLVIPVGVDIWLLLLKASTSCSSVSLWCLVDQLTMLWLRLWHPWGSSVRLVLRCWLAQGNSLTLHVHSLLISKDISALTWIYLIVFVTKMDKQIKHRLEVSPPGHNWSSLQTRTEITDFHNLLNTRELSPLVTKHIFNIPECAHKLLRTKQWEERMRKKKYCLYLWLWQWKGKREVK